VKSQKKKKKKKVLIGPKNNKIQFVRVLAALDIIEP